MTVLSQAHLCSYHEKHDVSMKHIRPRTDESCFIQGNLIVVNIYRALDNCEGRNITIFYNFKYKAYLCILITASSRYQLNRLLLKSGRLLGNVRREFIRTNCSDGKI